MAAAFEEIQVERWDAPLVRLPDRDAVRDNLIARFVPPEVATDAAGPGVAHVGQLVDDHLGAVAAASPRLDGRAGFP